MYAVIGHQMRDICIKAGRAVTGGLRPIAYKCLSIYKVGKKVGKDMLPLSFRVCHLWTGQNWDSLSWWTVGGVKKNMLGRGVWLKKKWESAERGLILQ